MDTSSTITNKEVKEQEEIKDNNDDVKDSILNSLEISIADSPSNDEVFDLGISSEDVIMNRTR